MDEPVSPYEPPCRRALREKVVCEACGKRITLHVAKYRHLCVPALDRVKRATQEATRAIQSRAEGAVEAEKKGKVRTALAAEMVCHVVHFVTYGRCLERRVCTC